MTIPQDPFMLLSFINMKLRDENFENLDDLTANLGIDKSLIINKLKEAGFEYIEAINQFR